MIRILNARLRFLAQEGYALITVIGIGAVLLILATVVTTSAFSSTQKSSYDQDWNAALSAAYAGIDEYQSRLSNDSFYVQYGNPAANFSAGSSVVLPPSGQENPAFGIGTSGTWATVPGSDGRAKFRYEVNTSEYFNTGIIRVRATGLVNDVTRSVVADLRQTGFIDFLYFTDYEIQDPELSGVSSSCVRYEWAGRASSCGDIRFAQNDVINGPLHTNDTLLICRATFNGPVTTGNSINKGGGRLYLNDTGCSSPNFGQGPPAYAPVIGMPATNLQMKRETRSDLPVDVPNPGCLYTGPTSIVFHSNGRMTVKSPWSRATNVAGDPATSGSTPSHCGSISALRSASGATIDVPERNLIFVQNVPSVSGDPNYWASNDRPTGHGCRGNDSHNGLGYPISSESAPSDAYRCRNGDVFVEGDVHAKVTVAAENYVYMVGDIRYVDDSTDMLGLVGNNAVFVWNPVNSWGTNLRSGSRTIHAAILSVAHTVQVQNYNRGSVRGTWTVYGAIAQKFRGPVGTGNTSGIVTGFNKNYNYDPRLRYTAPPKFLSPVTSTYGVTTWMDAPAAFNSDGSYR